MAHGHLVSEEWSGFLDAFGPDNIGQVRVNDNTGEYEIHLVPGEGTIDFLSLFERVESSGYQVGITWVSVTRPTRSGYETGSKN